MWARLQKESAPFHLFLTFHPKIAQFHMKFFTGDVPQVSHFKWISLLGTCQKWTTSYEFLYLGRATSEPLHMNFCTWDVPQVSHFKWISLLWTCQKRATSNEFLYLGRAKSEPLHMNFFTLDVPKVSHFIWISLLGTFQKRATSYEFLYLGHPTREQIHLNSWCGHPAVNELMWVWSHVFKKNKNLRGGNTRLRVRIARAPFRRSFVSRLAIFERALAKRLGNVQKARVQNGFVVQLFSCSIRSSVYLFMV